MKKDSRPNEASSGLNGYRGHRGRTIPVAMLLILVVLVSAGSGVYAGASFFAQQGANITVTTTIYTTTTSWTTSTIWSTVTEVVQGVLTTVEYTTSTNTVTVTGSTSTPTGKIVTANGNARISTAQSKFGGASGLFGGAGYLSLADSADWDFGAGDFTIDTWVRFKTLPTNSYVVIWDRRVVDTNRGVALLLRTVGGTSWQFEWADNFVYRTTSISTGTWYHIAVVRTGNVVKIFQDGKQVGADISVSGAMPDLTCPTLIGAYGNNGTPRGAYLDGWLDEFRVSKGVGRWTSNFTPSSVPYDRDSSVVLLLHMDGADASTTFIDG